MMIIGNMQFVSDTVLRARIRFAAAEQVGTGFASDDARERPVMVSDPMAGGRGSRRGLYDLGHGRSVGASLPPEPIQIVLMLDKQSWRPSGQKRKAATLRLNSGG
jgi:hypothetical protein